VFEIDFDRAFERSLAMEKRHRRIDKSFSSFDFLLCSILGADSEYCETVRDESEKARALQGVLLSKHLEKTKDFLAANPDWELKFEEILSKITDFAAKHLRTVNRIVLYEKKDICTCTIFFC